MKRMRLDSILVVDLEATCWETRQPVRREFESEIIEVGVCVLDLEKGIQEKESILVKPQYSKVSDFCTQLTTLNQQDVDQGVSLEKACSILYNKYQASNRVWVSYGDYDRKKFQDECRSKSINYPFGPRHHNIKNLFALTYRLSEEVGMPEALELLGLKLEGTHHRGIDDAVNIAKIAQVLLEKRPLPKK